MGSRGGRAVGLAGILFFLSGASALVYQVAWQRILALHSGVGLYSVAMIVAAFMVGLGVGSHAGGALSLRLSGRGALRAFASLELAIGAFGAVSPALYYDWLYPRAAALPTPSWQGGLVHLLALFPPTALMGMSLPFLVRAMVTEVRTAGRTIGYLYGINVLGASFGALAAPWVLIRLWGIPGAVLAAAAGNGVAGLGALALGRLRTDEGETAGLGPSARAPEEAAEREPPGSRPFGLWVALYALSGFIALSLEIVWFRLMDVAVKSTAFTFGTVLAVYLLGSALGCLAGAPVVERMRRPLLVFLACQCALIAYAAVAVAALVRLPASTPFFTWFPAYWAEYDFFRFGHVWIPGTIGRLYVLLPTALFLPPTVLMGFSFPVLQRAVQDETATSGRKVGVLQAANIAGCVAGSLLVGLLGLSLLGTAGTLRLLVACGLVFAAVGLREYGRAFLLPGAVLLALLLALPGPEALWRRLHGLAPATPAFIDEDATSVVALTPESKGEWWRLSINGKGNSWLPYGGVHTVLGALPAVIHRAPRDVAVIGLGSGNTVWAASCRWETRSVSVFEIAAPQPRVLRRLAQAESLPDLRQLLRDGRVRVSVADGRRALEHDERRYDLIEADATWPESAYSGNLYSLEFFTLCARRLRPGGVMCTWAPTPRVYAGFRRAFPHVLETDSGSILVGSNEPLDVDLPGWTARLQAPPVVAHLGPANVEDVAERLRRCVPSTRVLPEWLEPNRDLYPRDEFASP